MDGKLLKPIQEASYLTTENAWRYRAILRYFYKQHEKMRHYLFPEEVLEYLREWEQFKDYSEEQLQQDLNQLVKWKNLLAQQETGKVRTIEEFKKKKFRYQCSPYTVEIERMVQNLEQLGDSFGGSLESTLFDRLYESLKRLGSLTEKEKQGREEDIYRAWEDIFTYFRQLTENSTDYIAYLKDEKIEERMKTEAFLTYKDALTEYLRDFIISMQQTSMQIEMFLADYPPEQLKKTADLLAEYRMRIPRLEGLAATKEELTAAFTDQWTSLTEWFLGRNGRESELQFLQNETNETIRRMTRFVQRLGEKHHNFRSRKKDYIHLAKWFTGIDELEKAHRLSSAVFGVFHTRHFFCGENTTDNIYQDVWDEAASEMKINPRIRTYKEKTRPTAIKDQHLKKKKVLEEHLKAKAAEQKLVDELIKNDRIILRELPEIEGHLRKTLLLWIGKAMTQNDNTVTTETGRKMKLVFIKGPRIRLHSADGVMEMPDMEFQLLSGEEK